MVESILKPTRLWRAEELWQDALHPPAQPGVYGWYFDQVPAGVPVDGCVSIADRWLLYVGISPARPGSKQQLRGRLRQHFRGNARGSTLRKTLGCLLQEQLGLEFRRVSAKSMRFTPESEVRLSRWMDEHARVAWATTPEPWVAEAQLIEKLALPLNLRGNEHHPFYADLRDRRAGMVVSAKRLPIWKQR